MVIAINGREEQWRSELQPGWNWDEDLKPYADGMTSCPMTHREYVVSGRIRYLMTDGIETEGKAGDLLFIPPGHRGWVLGDEPSTTPHISDTVRILTPSHDSPRQNAAAGRVSSPQEVERPGRTLRRHALHRPGLRARPGARTPAGLAHGADGGVMSCLNNPGNYT
jgi:hypothetical protein